MTKRFMILSIAFLLLLLSACSNASEKEAQNENPKEGEEETNEDATKDEDDQPNNEDDSGKKNEEEANNKPVKPIVIDFDETLNTITVNGVRIGDTIDTVESLIGEPLKVDYDEAFSIHTYEFPDASYAERLVLIFEQEILVEIAASTSKEGNLVTKKLIRKFPGVFFMATQVVTDYENIQARYALLLSEDEVIVVDTREEDGEIRNFFYVTPAYYYGMGDVNGTNYFKNKEYFTQVSKDLLLNY
ncbi:hypothetical protein CIB95_12630 [Lottiidibacillus patelloidae]|uniref:Lipoprotein n=1 Tax=Lottiidibacillus patelloidae TaxID=2670334 RepID=A0A263BRC7_9BACI|nr:hypothetical protein [Lottiidibacillus patelloidae]OZM56263.1 hypothetical protein CIB95_12630 [Lottiidibacillus patelloidae]